MPWDPNLSKNLHFVEFDWVMNSAMELNNNANTQNAKVTLCKWHLQLLVGLGKKLFKSMGLVCLEKWPTLKPYTFLLSPINKSGPCIDVLYSYILDTCTYIYIYIKREREREWERESVCVIFCSKNYKGWWILGMLFNLQSILDKALGIPIEVSVASPNPPIICTHIPSWG